MGYAEKTEVPVEKTMSEIRKVVQQHGATNFGSVEGDGKAAVAFTIKNRHIRMMLDLPKKNEKRFTQDRYGSTLADATQYKKWDQACRSSWRALFLSIKAKLVTVESGISTFESEFLAHIVLPNSQTVGEWLHPQLEAEYSGGKMPSPIAGLLDPPKPTAQIMDIAAEQ